MKKLFFALLSAFALFSCSNSSTDEPIQEKNLLVGTWKLEKETYDEDKVLDECEKRTNLVFKEDQSLTSNQYSNLFPDNCTLKSTTGTYKYNKETKNLIFIPSNEQEEQEECTVAILNENELVLEYPDYSPGQDDHKSSTYSRVK